MDESIEQERPITDLTTKSVAIKPPVMPSGATFANDKAIWRDDEWHPQISSMVPVGYGPKGLMLSGSLYAIDCTVSGICSQPNTFEEYRNQLKPWRSPMELSLGLGDSEKLVGLTITGLLEETQLPR